MSKCAMLLVKSMGADGLDKRLHALQEEFQKDKSLVDDIMRRIENEDREEKDQKIKAQQKVQGYIRNFLEEQQQLKQQIAQQQQDEENRQAFSPKASQSIFLLKMALKLQPASAPYVMHWRSLIM